MKSPIKRHAGNLWAALRSEAEKCVKKEPVMAGFIRSHVLNHKSLMDALAFVLAAKLAEITPDNGLGQDELFALFKNCLAKDSIIVGAAKKDLLAVLDRDPAAESVLNPFLYFKGYQAIQTHRIAHHLWNVGREDLATYLQSQTSLRYGVDIHPEAKFGSGIMLDHATGIVIGQTAVVSNDVSILHGVTLGGTGKEGQDRHPKIGVGVLLGAGATVLGNIKIGDGARVAAGSVVLAEVPPHVTVVGSPARVVGKAGCAKPGTVMDQILRSSPETKSGTSRA